MRKLRTYLVDFIRADFRPGLYGVTALFLAACIAFNYAVDLEDSYIDPHRGTWIRFVLFLGLDAWCIIR
ncbi:hypothetical protein [Siphonobacter sp. BAB-5385]|uniref:hypothetical protein n=1 Tax=Siphonobacter sp. BAB-5385 TaxID=1864822 RepID=UPI0020CC33D1|nr:hypothetical protein [Siphonobacter sp. BAB-5385]